MLGLIGLVAALGGCGFVALSLYFSMESDVWSRPLRLFLGSLCGILGLIVLMVQLAGYGQILSREALALLLVLLVGVFVRQKGNLERWAQVWRARPSLSQRNQTAFGLGLLYFAILAVISLSSFPIESDTLAYRLPRIGLWLQEGSLAHVSSGDERVNYSLQNPALVMLWATAWFSQGFPGIGIVPLAGFLLCLGAIAYFGERLRASRTAISVDRARTCPGLEGNRDLLGPGFSLRQHTPLGGSFGSPLALAAARTPACLGLACCAPLGKRSVCPKCDGLWQSRRSI